MKVSHDEAIKIACRFAASGMIDKAATYAWHDDIGNYWVVPLPSGGGDIRVDSQSGLARWTRMTDTEWEQACDPRAMLLAVRQLADSSRFWQFICVLGSQLWNRLDECDREAISVTKRWQAGQEGDVDLWTVWFNAIGTGPSRDSGWGIADEWLESRSNEVFPPSEVCNAIRQVFGNPF